MRNNMDTTIAVEVGARPNLLLLVVLLLPSLRESGLLLLEKRVLISQEATRVWNIYDP
jgi:hypothetical protein